MIKNLGWTTTFKGLGVYRTGKAHRISFNGNVLVKRGMEDYSGWGWQEHVEWICDLSGLNMVTLVLLVGDGYVLWTDESVSEVWLLSSDYYKATARMIYTD
jgi:hypothetical protein